MAEMMPTDQMRILYSSAVSWRTQDGADDRDMSALRDRQAAEFDAMLARERAEAFTAGVSAFEEELVRQDRFSEATLRIAHEVRTRGSSGSQTEGADRG